MANAKPDANQRKSITGINKNDSGTSPILPPVRIKVNAANNAVIVEVAT